MWSRTNSKSQTTLSEYPVGTFLKTEDGYFYVALPNRILRFTTYRCLQSWSPQRVVVTTNEALSGHKISATKMKFRDGSLLWNQADAKMYLVSEAKVRHITSPDILSGLGVSHKDAVWVSSEEINLHEIGEPLR